MLSVLDEKWKDHLYDLDQLRNSIQYRAYGQKDPLVEYKKEAFEMFEDLLRDIQRTFAERFLKVQVSAEPPAPPPPSTQTMTGPTGIVAPPVMAPARQVAPPTTDDLFAPGTAAPPPAPRVV